MTTQDRRNFRTAPLFVRALSFIAAAATAFFVFHTLMQFIYQKEIEAGTFGIEAWTQELYFLIWMTTPLFLALIGTSIYRKPVGKWLLGFTIAFGIGHLLNLGNTYEWVDIPHLQYPQTLALLGILVCWLICVFKRKRSVIDFLKFIWLLGFIYSFAVPRFVPSGHEAGNFLLASMFIFPFLMTLGLINFYANKNQTHD